MWNKPPAITAEIITSIQDSYHRRVIGAGELADQCGAPLQPRNFYLVYSTPLYIKVDFFILLAGLGRCSMPR